LLTSDARRVVTSHFEAHVTNLAELMLNVARAEVPQLADAPAVILDRVQRHCELHVHAMVQILHRGLDIERADFTFVRENAVIRAREGYPLAAMLRAYRAGHRATWGAMSELLRTPDGSLNADAARGLLALSVFTMEYTNHISNVAAAAYTDEAQHQERGATRARAEVLDALLTGDLDASTPQRARQFGLEPGSDLVVLAVNVGGADEEQGAGSLTDCARDLERLLGAHSRGLLMEVRGSEVVGVAGAPPDFDRHVERLLLDALHKWAGGRHVRVGVSAVRPGLESVPLAHEDCRHALAHTRDERPVAIFRNLSVFDHLVATADMSTYRISPPWFEELVAADSRMGGLLLQTLRAYVDAHFSAKATAKALGVHVNTVYYRLRKFETISHRSTHDASTLLDAVTLLSLHRSSTVDVT
jgi:hypothetical protein